MKLIEWLKGDGKVQEVLRDLMVVGAISVIFVVVSQLALGVWTPMVAVESGSMHPNMKIGDIIVIQGTSKSEVTTWEDGNLSSYETFNNPGDVILYRPYGKEKLTILDQAAHIFLRRPYPPDKATPIIHRAMRWVDEGENMWEGGPAAPFSGYITKGDNNSDIDQNAGQTLGTIKNEYFQEELTKGNIVDLGNETYLDHNTGVPFIKKGDDVYAIWGINYLMPVREDWVIGTAKFRIPLVGYVRLLPNLIGQEIKDLFF